MKTIFITGASAGLGKAAAKLFQSKGWRVIATMRQPEKETELQHLEQVHLLALDVTQPEQVKQAVQQACATWDIDVVLNNAGFGLIGPLEACSEEQIMAQFNTNFFGVLRVTKAFIPYFREKRKGLFMTTSSICGLASYPLSSVYNASKWAIEGWSESMSYDLAQWGIQIKTICPGGIQSNYQQVMDVAQDADYAPLLKTLSEKFQSGELMEFSDPALIAETLYQAATDDKEQLRYLAGPDAIRTYTTRLQEGSEAYRMRLLKLFK